MLCYCEQCGTPYSPERVRTGDYHYQYCSALCQSNAGVIFERDILTARRVEHLSTLTDEEKAAIQELAESYPLEEAT